MGDAVSHAAELDKRTFLQTDANDGLEAKWSDAAKRKNDPKLYKVAVQHNLR